MRKHDNTSIDHHAARIMSAWLRYGQFNSADNARHFPCKKTIESTTATLIELLFPGLTTERSVLHSELFSSAVQVCSLISTGLTGEIRKALSIGATSLTAEKLDEATFDIVDQFIAQLPKILELLDNDIEAARRGDPAAKSKQEIIIAYPYVRAVAAYRLAHALHQLNVPLIPRIMTEWAHSITGIDLHPGATIGSGLFIDHGTGTTVGETAVIGNNVRIYQNVGLAARSLSADKIEGLRGKKRHPTIEDNCILYANAFLLGDIVVGANSTIGANVTLDHSVPSHSYVVPQANSKTPLVFEKRNKNSADLGLAATVG